MASLEYLKKYLSADAAGKRTTNGQRTFSLAASDNAQQAASHASPAIATVGRVLTDETMGDAATASRACSSRSRVSRIQADTVYRDATGRRLDVARLKPKLAEAPTSLAAPKLLHSADRPSASRQQSRQMNTGLQTSTFEYSSGPAQPSQTSTHSSRSARRDHRTLNRFGLAPGRFWDGVDRSNGYERRRLRSIGKRLDSQSQHEAWAREDM